MMHINVTIRGCQSPLVTGECHNGKVCTVYQCTSVLHSAAAETAETLINLPDPFKTHCHCNVYNYYAAHFPQGAVCQAFLKNTTGHRVSGS